MDDRLTLEDWKTFQGKEILEGSTDDAYGLDYANRIIEDSIGRWPDRRPVD